METEVVAGTILLISRSEPTQSPSPELLSFWEAAENVRALKDAINIAVSDAGLRRSKFLYYLENLVPDTTGMEDALGRLIRGGPKPMPIKCHYIMITLFYVYQRSLGDEVKERLASKFKQNSLFSRYDHILGETGSPQRLSQLAQPKIDSLDLVDLKYPKVKLKEGMTRVPPLDFVLKLVNVQLAMHSRANEVFFLTQPHVINDYRHESYVVITMQPTSDRHSYSLLTIRSGHQNDTAITYTHRQRRPKVLQGQSNGVMCPAQNGYTLFGGFETGSSMETLFIDADQVGRDKLDAVIQTLDAEGMPFFGSALLIRSTDVLWDTDEWFLKQDISKCSLLVEKLDMQALRLDSRRI